MFIIASEMRGVREIWKKKDSDYYPVGFSDADLRKVGGCMHGLPSWGIPKDVPNVVQSKGIEEIIIAIPSATETQHAGIRGLRGKNGVPFPDLKSF